MSDDATLDEFVEIQDSKRNDSDESAIKSEEIHPRFGKLPPEWSINEIADIAEVVGGSTPSTDNDDYWGGGIPWATPTDITALSGNTISETADTITEEGLESASTHLLPPYSVLMTSRASIGKCAVNTVEMATNQGFKNLVPEKEIETWYLYYRMLETANFLNSVGSGSTFDEVSKTEVQSVDIPIPPLPEQRKIATVLYTVDRAIEKTEEVSSQLKRIKQGLCQRLFFEGVENHVNFKESKYGKVPDNWNISKLSEVTTQIQAGSTPDTNVDEYYGGNIPWVKTGELSQKRVSSTEQTITQKGYQNSATHMFAPGTVLIAMYGATTGEVSLLEMEATTNQACCGVVTTDDLVPEYLYQQLNYLSNHMKSLSAGSGQQNISKGILEKFDVLVPPIEEQNSIVEVLAGVDESISENRATKEQLQRLKRGLQQDLLSGTVRTTDTNIEVPDEIAQHG